MAKYFLYGVGGGYRQNRHRAGFGDDSDGDNEGKDDDGGGTGDDGGRKRNAKTYLPCRSFPKREVT